MNYSNPVYSAPSLQVEHCLGFAGEHLTEYIYIYIYFFFVLFCFTNISESTALLLQEGLCKTLRKEGRGFRNIGKKIFYLYILFILYILYLFYIFYLYIFIYIYIYIPRCKISLASFVFIFSLFFLLFFPFFFVSWSLLQKLN